MQNDSKNRTLRNIDAQDDYLRITGQANAHDLARYLDFPWEDGSPTTRYARSLRAEGGICLAYGRRNQDGLDAPQSDSRDSKDFMLEVPGHHARDLLPKLRLHADSKSFQAPRRDICFTLRFDPATCSQVYRTWSDLLANELRRPCFRLGPDGNDWEAVSLQTHARQSDSPRFAILYDKHAQDPEEYPDAGTLRFEFRFQPEKQHQKRALFDNDPLAILFSWRLSMKAVELLINAPQSRSFAWTLPKDDSDLETMTANLLRSYGPTLARGLTQKNAAAYLHVLAYAALLQANGTPLDDDLAPARPVSLEAEDVSQIRVTP